MCRNIRTLHHFEPPATEAEIQAASLQFVRKVSGLAKPSVANTAVFDQAVADVATTVRGLLGSLVASGQPRDRLVEAAKAKTRALKRFGPRA